MQNSDTVILELYSTLNNTEVFQTLRCFRYEITKALNDQLTKTVPVFSTVIRQAVCAA